jgi:mRNA-degrading endonuclease RelE of RelBE toxin-antitoxin system
MHKVIPSKVFLKQIRDLNKQSRNLIKLKINLLKNNPFRFKRLTGYSLALFRIRLKLNGTNSRLIYCLEGTVIKLICILDRNKNYKDLKKYLAIIDL